MSSLPILHVFLLLLALHAPWAQAQPLRTQKTPLAEKYVNRIKEIMAMLNESSTVSPTITLDSEEVNILMEGDLWLNLDAFLNAANNFTKGIKIKANLEKLKELLPTPTPTNKEDPIHINDWYDFRKKIAIFLNRFYAV